jgi:ribonuclease HI
MSVKGFLEKYFKVEPSAIKVAPIQVLEPMVGTVPRRDLVEKQTRVFHIFTDGACSDNGKKHARGGFGVHFYSKKQSGLDISLPLMQNEPQTNNRGELRAIQAALDAIERYESLWSNEFDEYCIWSDSEYSIHSLTKWAAGWRRNGWKKSDGGLIQNIDLIRPIYEKLGRMSRVRLQHVRAHQRGRENEFPYDGNTEADRLARQGVSKGFVAKQ